VFESDDTNLAPGATQPIEQIYLRDTCQSVIGPVVPGCTPQTTLVSASASAAPGNAASTNPGIGALGLLIAFPSSASDLVSQSVSVDSGGHLGTADSVTPAVGPFGNFGVFATRAPNLLPANTSNQQIVSFNACFDVPPIPCSSAKGGVVSVDQNGLPGQGDSSNPAFAGTRVAFTSQASLISGVTGQQVYSSLVCLFPSALPC